MQTIVYGRDNCSSCDKIKKRLQDAKIPYEYEDIDKYIVYHKGWRLDRSHELLAVLLDAGNELPILKIGDQFYNSREGMIVLGL